MNQKGTQVFLSCKPSLHTWQKRIPAQRNSTPEITISRRNQCTPKCHPQHCTHSVRPAHKRPPNRQREMGHFAVQRQKQNQFIWAAHHLQNKTRVAETHKSVIQNYKVFPNLCTGQSTNMERAKVPISKADPNWSQRFDNFRGQKKNTFPSQIVARTTDTLPTGNTHAIPTNQKTRGERKHKFKNQMQWSTHTSTFLLLALKHLNHWTSERQNKTFYMGEHKTPSNFPATVSYAVTGENWCKKKELVNPIIWLFWTRITLLLQSRTHRNDMTLIWQY